MPRPLRWPMVLSLAGGMGWSVGVRAQSVPDLDVAWRWVDFGPESGLPPGAAAEMIEVDSLVWLRTADAVVWYDGFQWLPPTAGPDSLSGQPTSLVADGDGVLMVHGGRAYRGGPGGFREVALAGIATAVTRAVPTPEGDLFVTTADGVLWRTGRRGLERQLLPPMDDPMSLWLTDAGQIWADTRGGFHRWDGAAWVLRDARADTNRRDARLAQRVPGRTWAYRPGSPETRGLLRFDGEGAASQIFAEGDHQIYSMDARADGLAVFVYESGDVRVWDGTRWRGLEIPSPRHNGVRFVRVDDDGDFWFGTDTDLHLFRAGRVRWSVFRRPFPALFNRVNAILVTRDSATWLGTGAGALRDRDQERTYWEYLVPGEPSVPVTGLAEDERGDIWASSGAGYQGVLRWDGRGWRHLGEEQGFDVGTVHRVFARAQGGLWLASLGRPDSSGAGLWRLDDLDGAPTPYGRSVGLPDERVYAVAEASGGTVWVGGVSGLSRIRDGQLRRWTGFGTVRSEGSKVWDIALDPDGRPWMAINPDLAAGVAYLSREDSIRWLMPPGPIGARKVWSLVFDPEGGLWLGTEAGLLRYAEGEWTRLDESSGMPSTNLWPMSLDRSRLLLGTKGGGLVTLDLAEAGSPAPRVVVESVTTQDRAARVRFSTAAYWGTQPRDEVEARHRVDGGAWSPWGLEREPSLPRLTPGDHVVEFQAKGLFGRLSEPMRTTVRIPFPLVLRPEFALPVGGLLLLVLALTQAASSRRARHEAEIKEREQRLRTLMESAPEAIGIYDVDRRRFIEANRHALELLELREDQLSEVDPATMTPRRTERATEEFLARALRAGEGESSVFEWTVLTPSGAEIPCEVRLTRLPTASGTLLRASVIDMRDRNRAAARQRELEEQLRQSQKLEAVGQLTGGVAHDFNNLLTVIRGNLELLAEELRPDDEARELLEGAVQAAERSASLTQRLLAFSRRQTLAPGRVEVPALLEGLRDLLGRSLGEAYTLELRAPADTWPVEADRAQLESAIVNLALNARDAMPGGGRIVLESGNVPADAVDGLARELDPTDYVRLAVIDHGVGMDPDVVERAFDPFFTTKDVGKGTGLGLSMVYGYVAQSGGAVRIESSPGEGTTVAMFLPRCASDRTGAPEGDDGYGLPRGQGESILVVEDDPGVGALVVQFLTRLGYRPSLADSGDAALGLLRQGLQPAALVTDMVLPGSMNGADVAEAVRRERPGLPVLFMSGYSEERVWSARKPAYGGELLKKPFDLATLARKVRRTLVPG